MSPVAPQRAILRAVPATFDRCLHEGEHTPDVEQARAQHAAYATALSEAGVEVHVLDADDAFPDGVFVEDTAVVTGERALLTRPGAPSRRGEEAAVEEALVGLEIARASAPATLEGGDVLRAGGTLFVGRSRRTNDAGIRALTALGLVVRAIPVMRGLHLKTACTLASGDTLVYDAALLDPAPFREAGLDCVAVPDPDAANVLCLGQRLLVPAHCPRTADLLAARGLDVRLVPNDAFVKADGRLTCLSLRIPRAGEWCC